MNDERVMGVDVSAHQGRLTKEHWRRAAAAGVKYAWARIADGLSHLDATAGENLQEARNAGLKVGGYLFFRSSRDPIKQADLLLSQAWMLDLPPALDCEEGSDMKQPKELVRQAVKTCLGQIQKHEGRVIVYTCVGWWEPWMGPDPVDHDLWVAHYDVKTPLVPRAFSKQGWRFWQHTGKAKVDGLPQVGVDQNFFAGTEADLDAYCGRRC